MSPVNSDAAMGKLKLKNASKNRTNECDGCVSRTSEWLRCSFCVAYTTCREGVGRVGPSEADSIPMK